MSIQSLVNFQKVTFNPDIAICIAFKPLLTLRHKRAIMAIPCDDVAKGRNAAIASATIVRKN